MQQLLLDNRGAEKMRILATKELIGAKHNRISLSISPVKQHKINNTKILGGHTHTAGKLLFKQPQLGLVHYWVDLLDNGIAVGYITTLCVAIGNEITAGHAGNTFARTCRSGLIMI